MIKMKHVPNILSISRIFLSILLLFVVLHGGILPDRFGYEDLSIIDVHISWVNYFACLIFCIASITDFFDGYIAREYRCGSAFGEVFDPLADKMLILSGFLALLMLDRANVWLVFLILSREFFITGLRVIIASKNQSVKASNAGKYKTGAQIAAIGFLLADFFPGGTLLLYIATFLTLYSGAEYTIKYYKIMKQEF